MRVLGINNQITFRRRPTKEEEPGLKETINKTYEALGTKERVVITHGSQPLSTQEKSYIQNQVIIFLKSKLPATKRTCIPVKKQSWLIIIQNIYHLKILAIIQDTGRRKMVRNSINLLPPNALNMIANTL